MDEQSRLLFGEVLYWSMPLVLAAAIAAGIFRLRSAAPGAARVLRATLREQWPGLVSAALLVALVFALFPPRLRVQFDETELLSASVVMSESHANLTVTESIPDGRGGIKVVDFALGRRPPLFPFLVSLLHGLTGPLIQNAFALNAALLFVLLVLAYAGIARSLGRLAGFAAQLLLVGTPCLVGAATSAGFDLLALVLLLVVNLAARDCLSAPNTAPATLAPRLAWLAGAGLLFSYSRYESLALFLVVLAGVLILLRRRRGPALRALSLWPLAAFALLTIPLVWLFAESNPAFLRAVSSPMIRLFTELDGRALFSVGGAFEHVVTFARLYLDPRPLGPFSGPADLCAVLAAVLAFGFAWRRRAAADLLPALCLLLPLLLVLAWFYGDASNPTATRLFLGVAAAGALGPVALSALFRRRFPPVAVLAASLLWCGVQCYELRAEPGRLESPPAVLTVKLDRLLDQLSFSPRRTLLVSRFAPYLNVRGLIALTPESFERNAAMFTLMKTRHDLDDILLVETAIDTAISPGTALMAELREKSGGTQLAVDPERPYVRISRLGPARGKR